MMTKLNFDRDWRFLLEEPGTKAFHTFSQKNGACDYEGYTAAYFNAETWQHLDLPHDWVPSLPKNPEYGLSHGHFLVNNVDLSDRDPDHKMPHPGYSVGWYRKTFDVPAEWENKLVTVCFEGVFRDASVWINGEYIDRHYSGYTEFSFEIGDNLLYDGTPNTICVRVDASQTEGWWYEGAGIYRHVYLKIEDRVSFVPEETVIRPNVDGHVEILSSVLNETGNDRTATVTFAVGGVSVSEKVKIPAWGKSDLKRELTLENPHPWSVDDPYLYHFTATLSCEGFEDTVETYEIGFRSFVFDADRGFFLNGERVFLKGVCVHQDFAVVGVALDDGLQEFKLRKLKEMGVNAYRTAHGAPAKSLVTLCDRLGILVLPENRNFGSSTEALREVSQLVRSFRNHPSVLLWMIGNEEHEVQNNSRGRRISEHVIRTVRALDPTRPISYAGNNYDGWTGINETVDVRGFNYLHRPNGTDFVPLYHAAHPEQPMFGSEESSCVTNRGWTETEFEHLHTSCYDETVPRWGSTAEGWLKYYDKHPFIAGGFAWTGFDYHGEAYPHFHDNTISSFGIIDICGHPKDIFYYYQSWWADKKVLHLFPDWNRKAGEVVRVCANTNCEEVELFLNGRSLGRKAVEHLGHAEWEVPFEAGKLEAIGYDGGKESAKDVRVTAGAPSELRLTLDYQPKLGECAVVTASVYDKEGNPVPDHDTKITFTAEGGEVIGLENGNPSSFDCAHPLRRVDRRPLTDWFEIKDGEKLPYSAFEPSDGKLFYYQDFDHGAFDDVIEDHFYDKRRYTVYFPTPDWEEKNFVCSFEDEGGEAVLDFERLDGNYEITLNGELIAKKNKSAFPQGVNVTTKKGENILTVKLLEERGQIGIRKGVYLVRTAPAEQKRNPFFGLLSAIIREDTEEMTVTASAEGLAPASLTVKAK